MSTRRLILLGLLVPLAVTCTEGSVGTHIGNPGELTFRVASALDASEPLTFADDAGTRYRLIEARIAVRHVELYLVDDVACAELASALSGAACDDAEDRLRVDGPFVLDLLDAAPLAGLGIPPLAYSRIDYRIDDARLDDGLLAADDPLVERSFVARASFTDPDTGEPAILDLRLRFNEDARVEEPDGVTLPESGLLSVDFDPAAWLSGAPIQTCLDEGDLRVEGGTLLIDEDDARCSGVESPLKDNIKNSTRLSVIAR